MSIYLEFPPNRLTAIRSAYLAQQIRGADGITDEKIQDNPILDGTGTRMIVGSTRIQQSHADNLLIGNAPWLIIHNEWPADWVWPEKEGT
jgi:hypothetical protein